MNAAKALLIVLITAILTSGWWAACIWIEMHHGVLFIPLGAVTAGGAAALIFFGWDK